jgi:carbamoylphosphate synthase large subunit
MTNCGEKRVTCVLGEICERVEAKRDAWKEAYDSHVGRATSLTAVLQAERDRLAAENARLRASEASWIEIAGDRDRERDRLAAENVRLAARVEELERAIIAHRAPAGTEET